MNSLELAKNIALAPRAVILTGNLTERFKNSEADQAKISGFEPHYAMTGCPRVQFNPHDEFIPMQQAGAAIEASFTEQFTQPEFSAIATNYGRALNMVHLQFGRQGLTPTPTEAKVLREAGELLKRASGGQALHLVAFPIFTSAAYGVAAGRLYPLGVFNQAGEALWLNPLAVGTLLQAAYPATQIQRSMTAPVVIAAPAAEPKTNWYATMSASLGKATKLTGAPLHNLVLGQYADQLVLQGKAADRKAALEIAKREYEASRPSMPELPKPKTAAKKLTSARV